MLSIRNFSKAYHGNVVVQLKSLTLDTGMYWLKGENGSGKTSFFKSIAGILPHEGEISIDEFNLKRHPVDYRMRVNYAEAEPLFPGFLTPKDLVTFVGTAKQSTPSQQSSLVAHFGVDAYFSQACDTFSSGMMKKLSLVLAFLGSPRLVILDEPLITLDEGAGKALMQLIHQRLREGTTFLLSSHQAIQLEEVNIDGTHAITNKEIVSV